MMQEWSFTGDSGIIFHTLVKQTEGQPSLHTSSLAAGWWGALRSKERARGARGRGAHACALYACSCSLRARTRSSCALVCARKHVLCRTHLHVVCALYACPTRVRARAIYVAHLYGHAHAFAVCTHACGPRACTHPCAGVCRAFLCVCCACVVCPVFAHARGCARAARAGICRTYVSCS